MQQYKKILGKVMMTPEGTYDNNKIYEPLSLVTDEETGKSYISRKEVSAGTQINNREYWQPVASSGIIDNGVIILNRKNNDGQIPIYDLKSATEAVVADDRKGGVILGFLGFNPEVDTVPTWKLYQYNDVSPSNWTNIDYWLPMDYTNKYAGWFDNEEALYDSVPFPKVGMYAYVGNSASSAVVYRCYNDRVWQPTEDKAFSGVVNLADEEDITSKQNKLKFKDKEYNPAQFSGLGKLYLRKNIVDGKNILIQTMIQATNTIYIIQYDYDLQGETITIPENCVLQFEGGSFKNGVINGSRTKINDSVSYNIFNDSLGKGFELPYIDLRWVGGISDYNESTETGTDNSIFFERAIKCIEKYYNSIGIKLVGQYYIEKGIITSSDINIFGFHNKSYDFGASVNTVPSSPSFIAVGANITAFTMIGRGTDFTVAHFSFKNLKIANVGAERTSTFLLVTTSYAPSRVCVVEECEFSRFDNVMKFIPTKHTCVGNLTISKCAARRYNCFIYASADGNNGTLTNFILENSNIEDCWGDTFMYIHNAFGNIRIINNIIENINNGLDITLLNTGTITIEDNYFEKINGVLIRLSTNNPDKAKVWLKNFHNELHNININGYIIKEADFDRYTETSSFSRCYIDCDCTYLKLSNCSNVVLKDFHKGGLNYNYNNLDTLINDNFIGENIGTTRLQKATVSYNAGDVVYVAFYTGSVGLKTIEFWTLNNSGGLSNSSRANLYNTNFIGLCICKVSILFDNTKKMTIHSPNSEGLIAGLQIVPSDKRPCDIRVPHISNILPCGLASFEKPIGFTSIYNSRLVTWNGNKWFYSDGTEV